MRIVWRRGWPVCAVFTASVVLSACGADPVKSSLDASLDGTTPGLRPFDGGDAHGGSASEASTTDGATRDASSGDGSGVDAPLPCTTRVTYATTWVAPEDHPLDYDDAPGVVTWDGTCTDDGTNSYAVLSNGWKPVFAGHGGCEMALDLAASCPGSTGPCSTRLTYGPGWLAPANHPQVFDDVDGRVLWGRACVAAGDTSYAALSNGWRPTWSGPDACDLSLEYLGCGGLYENPVVAVDCPDPGVLYDGERYVVACTGDGDGDGTAFAVRTSTDLVSWHVVGSVFAAGHEPSWADGDYWAPEIHAVGAGYVAYFSAHEKNGNHSVGAATSASSVGPFTDLGHPLVTAPSTGVIDANEFEDVDGTKYLLWKVDGNSVGLPTPIEIQALSADGLSLTGARHTLITNDPSSWEGAVTEAPWLVRESGTYYLFYSGNSYANGTYGVGVARSSTVIPVGDAGYQKTGAPIVSSSASWTGPGHCSVVKATDGETYMVYHSWAAGHVNGPDDGRLLLVDLVSWDGGVHVPVGPSLASLPMP